MKNEVHIVKGAWGVVVERRLLRPELTWACVPFNKITSTIGTTLSQCIEGLRGCKTNLMGRAQSAATALFALLQAWGVRGIALIKGALLATGFWLLMGGMESGPQHLSQIKFPQTFP